MTQSKHFKALIRARMSKTGESYSIARGHLLGTLGSSKPELVAEFKAHDKHVAGLAFVPGGRELISGGFSGRARIWSTADWSLVGELTGHTGSVNGFGISGDGARVVTASSDMTVRLWDLTRRVELARLGKHSKAVVAVGVSASGDLAATGAYDGNVRLWSLEDQIELKRFSFGDRVGSVAFHPLKPLLTVSGAGPEVIVYQLDGTEAARIAGGTRITAIAWTGDGEFLIGSGGNTIRIWSRDDWEEVRAIAVEPNGDDGKARAIVIGPIAINHDSSLLAAGWEHHVGLWRFDSEVPAAVLDGLPKGVYNLAFHEDGHLLGVGCADGRVRVWSV